MKTINKLHWLLLVTLIAVACSSDPVVVPDPPKKPDEPTPEPPQTASSWFVVIRQYLLGFR